MMNADRKVRDSLLSPRRRRWRVGISSMLAVAGLVWISHAATPQVHALRDLRVGDAAPDFAALDLEGKLRERDTFDGEKGTLLFFWATWSPRSLEGLPILKELWGRYGDQGLAVVAVNVEGQRPDDDELARIKRTVEREELEIPMLVDHGLNVFSEYGVVAVPSTVLLDAKGTIVFALDGFPTGAEDELENAVKVLLGLEVAPTTPLVSDLIMQPRALGYFNMGKTFLRQGFYDKALANFEQAAQADTMATNVQLLIGETKVLLGDWQGALGHLDRAAQGESYTDLAHVLRSEVKLQTGRTEEAIADAEKALEIHPDYLKALMALGRARLAAGDFEGASEALLAARRMNPLLPAPYYYLGELHLLEGRKEETLSALRSGVEVALGLATGGGGLRPGAGAGEDDSEGTGKDKNRGSSGRDQGAGVEKSGGKPEGSGL
jgi:peroxiredoxin